MDHFAPPQDHLERAEHRSLKRSGGKPLTPQGYVLSRWDRHSAHNPLTRAERRYLRETRRPAVLDAPNRPIRLVNAFGAVVALFPRLA